MKKYLLIISFIISQFIAYSTNYKIDYVPTGKVIRFDLDSVIIITDTDAIKHLENIDEELNLILSKSEKNNEEAILLTEKQIIKNILEELIKKNKCQIIFNKSNINLIKIKKRRKYNGALVYLEFIDKKSKNIFLIKIIKAGFINLGSPQF